MREERPDGGPAGDPRVNPPPMARRLLALLVGAVGPRETLAGLEELFRLRVEKAGVAKARRWYWRQVLAFAPRWRSVSPRRVLPTGTLLQDIGFAFRALLKSPVFAIVSGLTLALGIGASLAMFGIVEASLLRALPYADADRLVVGRATFGGDLNPYVAAPDFRDYREGSESFEHLAAILPFAAPITVTGLDRPERVMGTTVSTNFFATLGVLPQVGRSFSASEGTEVAPGVVVVSDRYWRNRMRTRSDVAGQVISLDGEPFTVIGVMPAGFHFLVDVDLWLPMRPDRDAVSRRDRHNWFVLGRLESGVTPTGAQSDIDVISAQLAKAYPETNSSKSLLLTDLRTVLVADFSRWLSILSLAAFLVLLIACGNVAGMILARAPSRRRELSVRAALGADGSRLRRQLLAESVMLSLGGGLLGLVVAVGMQRLVLAYLRTDQLGLDQIEISGPMLFAALILSMATGLAAGLYPAMKTSHGNLAGELKTTAGRVGGGGTAFRSGLIVAQIALSMVLLVGSGLLVRSLVEKRRVDPGFDVGTADAVVLTAEVDLPAAQYTAAERNAFFTRLLATVTVLPGVTAASAISHVPILQPRNRFRASGSNTPEGGQAVFLRAALPGYFQTMDIPLRSGRVIQPSDGAGGAPVAVVSRSLARAFFGDEEVLGRTVELDYFGNPRALEIVGVVNDVHIQGLELDAGVTIYVPQTQLPYGTMNIVVRTIGNAESIAAGIRTELAALDGNIPLSGLTTLDAVVAESLSDHSIITLSLTIYALLPLLIAAVGLYAVVASYVNQRLHEIGIRMALGAEPGRIGVLVLGRGLIPVGVGVVVGLMGAFAGARVLRGLLFGIQPTDVGTFAGVTVLVVGIALLACAVPVARAIRSDPTAVLQAM